MKRFKSSNDNIQEKDIVLYDWCKEHENIQVHSAPEILFKETAWLDSNPVVPSIRHRIAIILARKTAEDFPQCWCGEMAMLNKTSPRRGFRRYCSPEHSRSRIKFPQMSKEFLIQKRNIECLGMKEIGKLIGCSETAVYFAMEKYGLNDNIDARRKNKNVLPLDYNKKIFTINHYSFIEEVTNFIKTISNTEIIPNYKVNNHLIDVFLPEYNFAINYISPETQSLDYKARIKQTQACLDNNINLVQFYFDEWVGKQEILKSMIRYKLKKASQIAAKNCEILLVNTAEKAKFLTENHLQGDLGSLVSVGLKYNDELVALMSFIKPRFNSKFQTKFPKSDWELGRFAVLKNYYVIGGFSKLLEYAIKNCEINGIIVSYADRRLSVGDVYLKNGFEIARINDPDYFYVNPITMTRINRISLQKRNFPEWKDTMTELEIATKLGYIKIWGCGTLCLKRTI